ncbi:uncharacterized protein YkwD [Mumia flava]|uniref:Uncharacterized protein YkwD n=1 Tax=Mumia flava TaxID=1348852 RepID=A0A0B2BH01_9ACTN|nr:CAP domain-containing protein [Mumia flava]PJJ56312.1 uncharacterized protein YkwD [Mumia flava]
MRIIVTIAALAASLLVAPAATATTTASPAGRAASAGVPGSTPGALAAARRGLRPGVYERRVVRHTNRKRTNRGLRGLRRSACLDRFAQRSANRIARNGRLTHQNLRPVLDRCNAWMVGENIAYGYVWPRRVVRAWMASPGHRANILQRRYRRIGVGMARDASGTVWVAQVFGQPR